MRLLVNRADYHEAALRVLAEEGAGAVKVTRLCSELGVTTGSFYGYFGSLDGFVDEFLEYWSESQTARVIEIANAQGDPAERIRLLKRLGSSLPHAAEGAIRAWAGTNPAVAKMQVKVDKRRLDALTDALRPAARDAREARVLGTMAMTLLVGLQQWRKPVTTRQFNVVFNEFQEFVEMKMAAASD
ncbi:TetR/AcrR family transcriptional regulator [Nocardioides sp. NPDC006273]|uniref:TetR/AcrR family transcriptional regulator n=1 Tax=Nocardioides sp. NPDC006273 TaxID=3155598 RepID=UPI00339E5B17